MRKIGVLAFVLSLSVLGSCGGGGGGGGVVAPPPPPPPPPPPTTCPASTVCMLGASFSPTQLTVTTGTNVGFSNESGVIHDVVFDTPAPAGVPADIGTINSPSSVSRNFATAGIFNFHCTIHGGMNGRVTVQ